MIIGDVPPKPVVIVRPFHQENKQYTINGDCDEILTNKKFDYLDGLDCARIVLEDHLKNTRIMNSFATTSGTSVGSQSLSDATPFVLGTNRLGDRL